MNDFFQENKKVLFVMIGALALFAVVLTLLIVRPLIHDLTREENNVTLAREEAKVLQARLDGLSDDATNIDVEQLLLEKKVPSERKLDEYILSLQQLEQYSNSVIERIGFSYDSSINAIDEEDIEENESEISDEAQTQLEEDMNEQLDEVEEQAPVFLTEIPEELEVMTVTITALVPSYEELVNLVRAIEDQDRVSILSRMHATIQTEEEKIFDEDEELIALEIDVSTFYYAD